MTFTKVHRRLAGTLIGVAIVGASYSAAELLSTPPVIQGCFAKSTGALRIVIDVAACKSNEVPITWNQAGVEGPAGPAAPVAEAWHEVGSTGEPQFNAPWVSEPQSVGPICSAWSPGCPEYGSVAFYKDADDVVHLRGVAKMTSNSGSSVIFQLPEGYRPASASTFRVVNSLHPDMTVTIYGDGYVQVSGYPSTVGFPPGEQRFWLDGLAFRLQ